MTKIMHGWWERPFSSIRVRVANKSLFSRVGKMRHQGLGGGQLSGTTTGDEYYVVWGEGHVLKLKSKEWLLEPYDIVHACLGYKEADWVILDEKGADPIGDQLCALGIVQPTYMVRLRHLNRILNNCGRMYLDLTIYKVDPKVAKKYFDQRTRDLILADKRLRLL